MHKGKTGLNPLNNLIYLTLNILILIIPFVVLTYTNEYYETIKNFILTSTLSILLILWTLTRIFNNKPDTLNIKNNFILLFILSSLLLSTIFSLNTDISIWGYHMRMTGGLISNLTLVGLYFLITNTIQTKRQISHLVSQICISITLLALFTILKAFNLLDPLLIKISETNPQLSFINDSLFTPIGNPNSLATLFLIVLPISIFKMLNNPLKNKIKIILGSISALILITAISITTITEGYTIYSTAIWVLLGIILLSSFILMYLRKNKPNVQIFLNSFLLIFAIFSFFYATEANFRSKVGLTPDFTRYYEIPGNTSWEILNKSMTSNSTKSVLLGTGLDTYPLAFAKYRPIEQNLQPNWFDNYTKSNTLIESIIINSGIYGVLLFLVSSFFILKFIYEYSLGEKRHLTTDYFTSISLSTILMLLGMFFSYYSITILFFSVIIIALLMRTKQINEYETLKEIEDIKPQRTIDLAVLILIICLVIIYMTLKNYIAEIRYTDSVHETSQTSFEQAYNDLTLALELNNSRDYYHRKLAEISLTKLEQILLLEKLEDVSIPMQESLLTLINSELDLSVKLNPKDHENWQTAAMVYKRLSELSDGTQFGTEAIYSISKAIELNPNNPDNYLMLGYLYEYSSETKLRELAENAYTKAYELQPAYSLSIVKLGEYLESVKKYELALSLYTISLQEIYKTDSEFNDFLEEKVMETKNELELFQN